MYCVKLKENHNITSYKLKEKIEKLELKTPKDRFPDVKPPKSAFEAYYWGTKDECLDYIAERDHDIRDLFTCQFATKESL